MNLNIIENYFYLYHSTSYCCRQEPPFAVGTNTRAHRWHRVGMAVRAPGIRGAVARCAGPVHAQHPVACLPPTLTSLLHGRYPYFSSLFGTQPLSSLR